MQPYQERVVEEKNDLDGKIDRLRSFLLRAMPIDIKQAELIRKQFKVMQKYSAILQKRIELF